MTQEELRRLARVGAEARLTALQQEMTAIYRAFPDLRRTSTPANPYTAGVKSAVAGVRGAVKGAVRRRRRFKMPLEARQRIAEAQRKRWADWKAQRSAAEGGVKASNSKPARSRKKK